jgi:uncharacterized protein YceH (UPF0502 family)
MNLDESAVRDGLSGLQDLRLAGPAGGADSRVTKYEHRLQDVFNLSRGEMAVLCVLLLRGAQTPGELRGRTERMHRFEDLEAVQSSLRRLIQREPPLAAMLPRQPGTKESRFAHLLSGEVDVAEPAGPSVVPSVASEEKERIARLEEQVASLQCEISDLKALFGEFRKQFE